MIRCGLMELFFPGGGYALLGNRRLAAASYSVFVAGLLGVLYTPWVMWLMALLRTVTVIDAGRRGRRGAPAGGWQWKPMLLVGAMAFGTAIVTRLAVIEAFRIPSVSMAPTLELDDLIEVDKLSIHWRGPERGEVISFDNHGRTWVKRVIAVAGDEVAVRDGVLYVNGKAAPRTRIGPVKYRNREEGTGREHMDDATEYEERFAGRVYRIYDTPFPDEDSQRMHDYPRPDMGATGCDAQGLGDGVRRYSLTPTTSGGCRVPAGTVFVMGDNRYNSNDSRVWGALPVDAVFGRVIGVWWSGGGGMFSRVGRIE